MGVARLRMGVVGVGGRGSGLVRAVAAVPEVELTAVADVVAAQAEKVAAQAGVPGHTSHVALLESGLVEAVLIGTPHPFHAQIAVDAAERGIHVLTEKPIAVRVAEADRMVAAARRAGVRLGVMFQRRLEPLHRQAREIIASGALGALHEVEMSSTGWYRLQSYYEGGAWRGTWKGEGGGILANQAPHDLDLLAWLGGMPAALTATLRRRVHRIEVENTVSALLEYGGTQTGFFRATTADPQGRRSIEITGELGRLAVRDGKLLHCRYPRPVAEDILHTTDRRATPFTVEWREVPLEGGGGDTTGAVIAAFARAVAGEGYLVATGEDGLRALELANAMHLSGLTGRRVRLPVDRAEIDALYGDLAAGRLVLDPEGPRAGAG